jgi:hypothetical protein
LRQNFLKLFRLPYFQLLYQNADDTETLPEAIDRLAPENVNLQNPIIGIAPAPPPRPKRKSATGKQGFFYSFYSIQWREKMIIRDATVSHRWWQSTLGQNVS